MKTENYGCGIIILTCILILACKEKTQLHKTNKIAVIDAPVFLATAFDFPVGKPDAKGYYNAQSFGENRHLGDDWNGVNGGNSDLGDPIYNVANGIVVEAKNHEGGWGNVIRIRHTLPSNKQVESLYAHCDTILVKKGDRVAKGTKIGTIGTANGIYLAHLHFEIRSEIGKPLGGGYAENTSGYENPTVFIKNHRRIK